MIVSAFNFESLTGYKKSLSFSKEIYIITKTWPREYLFGLIDQLRRASLSIPLNIAEGTSRSKKDFAHFLQIAKGSCFECIPILELAKSLDILDTKNFSMLYNEAYELAKMLSGLRRTIINK